MLFYGIGMLVNLGFMIADAINDKILTDTGWLTSIITFWALSILMKLESNTNSKGCC